MYERTDMQTDIQHQQNLPLFMHFSPFVRILCLFWLVVTSQRYAQDQAELHVFHMRVRLCPVAGVTSPFSLQKLSGSSVTEEKYILQVS